MRGTSTVRLLLSPILFSAIVLLAGCSSVRYTRDWSLAGSQLSDTLELSGDSFRLERMSGDGMEIFLGRFDAQEDLWRFEIESWKPPESIWVHFSNPLVYVFRGHAFMNGIAFYAVTAPRASPVRLFIRVPSDYDVAP